MTEDKASEQAIEADEPVEVLSKRGEQRTVLALPDGGFEVIEHLRPVRARRDGEWKMIDATLSPSNGRLLPGNSTVGLRFSDGGDDPLAVMDRAGRSIAFSWPTELPEPVISGGVAEYRGVLGPDVDLRVRALADGFTHTLVVKSAEAAADPRLAELTFGLQTARLEVSENQAGVLTAADSGSGSPVFEAPQPVMWDSSGSVRPAARSATAADPVQGPPDGAKTSRLEVDVTGGRLTLTPDRTMLTAPDTRFPVFIDPVWTTSKASRWGMVSSGWPNQAYYKFNGKSTEGVGRCEVAKDYRCVKNQTKRIFFRMPLPSIKGRYVDSVEFVAYETHAHNCDNPTVVQLWRASALKASATWNNTADNWGEHLASRDVAYCSKAPVEFGGSRLRAHVQSAVNKGYHTITFGLKAYSESSMAWWKRFADDAYLKIRYNNPPEQPDTDLMFANPGTTCLPSGEGKIANEIPIVYATLYDKDNEDRNKVRAQFTLHWANKADGSDWGEKWTSGLTAPLTSGSQFQMKLPPDIPEGTRIGWGVRAYDGTQYSAWSYAGAQTGCYFYYEPAVPGKPTITSQEYPNDGEWHGGVGETGRFVIADSEKVAGKYRISLNGAVVSEVNTTDGAERVVVLAPDKSGPNIVTVQAFAPSGQDGPTVSYEFRVNTGADPVARFTMDEDAGSTAVTSTGPGRPAWLRGSAALGGEGRHGTALTLDGVYGFAESTVPVVDATESFTVSAWAKPTRYGMSNVLAQNANFQSAFQLGIQPQGEAVFKKPSTDTDDGGGVWQQAMDDTPLPIGEWSHLTGVYDKGAAQLRLYVDGRLQAAVNAGTPLESHGAFQIGRSIYNGSFMNYWPGSIDDVGVFTQPLSDEQTQQLAAGTIPGGTGQVAHWSMDEAAGKVRVYSPVAPWRATLHGGATLGAEGQEGGALQLDNTARQYAATERPVVNTLRSFAVSAWVKVDGSATSPTQNFTAVSARGDHKSGFYLKYVEETNRWVFARSAHDSADTGWFQATSKDPARTDEWTHLVGVYDSIDRRLKIYVNGEKGTDSPEVTSRWRAAGGLEIGRSQWAATPVDHWAGRIDELRVYDRILGEGEIGEMVAENPVLEARWTFNKQPVDDTVGGLPEGAPELTLSGGAAITEEAGWGTLSPGGLLLNPEQGGFAETAGPVVRTDDSFTVAGWVRNQGLPQHAATVFSQAGDNANAFILRYVPGENPDLQGQWQVEMRNGDDSALDPLIASHSTFTPYEWAHLTVVYDALNNKVSLYVNGELQETADGVSQEGGAFGFPAENGGLQIGRNKFAADGTEFWVDAIDDVQVFSTALPEEQVNAIMFDPEPEDSP